MSTVVHKKPGQTEDKLIADFRKKILEDGVIDEIREKVRYRKPSEIRQERLKLMRRGRRRY